MQIMGYLSLGLKDFLICKFSGGKSGISPKDEMHSRFVGNYQNYCISFTSYHSMH